MECPRCKAQLRASSDYHLEVHQRSDDCKKRTAGLAASRGMLSFFRASAPAPAPAAAAAPPAPAAAAATAAAAAAALAPAGGDGAGGAVDEELAALLQLPISAPVLMLALPPAPPALVLPQAPLAAPCIGAAHPWPQPFLLPYPFSKATPDWSFVLPGADGTPRFKSSECTGTVDKEGCCTACSRLQHNTSFRRTRDSVALTAEHPTIKFTPSVYLTMAQLASLRASQSDAARKLRLSVFNASRRVDNYISRIDTHRRLLLAC